MESHIQVQNTSLTNRIDPDGNQGSSVAGKPPDGQQVRVSQIANNFQHLESATLFYYAFYKNNRFGKKEK